MSSRGFCERILEVDQDGTAITNSTSQLSILPAALQTTAFQIGYFDRVRVLKFCFSGRISVQASANTLAIALRLGTIDVLASGAMSMNANAKTNVHWVFEGELTNRVYGNGSGVGAGTMFFPKACKFTSEALANASTNQAATVLLPFGSAPANGQGINNSLSHPIDVLVTWGAAASTYSIQMQAGHIDVYS